MSGVLGVHAMDKVQFSPHVPQLQCLEVSCQCHLGQGLHCYNFKSVSTGAAFIDKAVQQ